MKGPWKTGGCNQKRLGNRPLVTWFFWLHMIIYDYFSSVFCIVPKKILLLKYRNWVSHLKNRNHYAKAGENARINFSIRTYCTLLLSRKENFKFFEVALSAVLAMAQWAALWICEDITIEILPIPHWKFTCSFKTTIKALKQGAKFVQT